MLSSKLQRLQLRYWLGTVLGQFFLFSHQFHIKLSHILHFEHIVREQTMTGTIRVHYNLAARCYIITSNFLSNLFSYYLNSCHF